MQTGSGDGITQDRGRWVVDPQLPAQNTTLQELGCLSGKVRVCVVGLGEGRCGLRLTGPGWTNLGASVD